MERSEHALPEGQPQDINGLDADADLFNQSAEGDAGAAEAPALDEAQAADKERARKLGWQDKDAYLARPGARESAWVDAGEFLNFHERVEASRKRENIRLQKELEGERIERTKLAAEVEALKKFQGEFTQARGEIQESTLLSERRSALENQDYDRVNQLDSQIMDMRIARKVPAATPAQQNVQQQLDPRAKEMLDDFAVDYPIYKDQNMQKVLVKGMVLALQADPALRDRALLDEAHDTARRIWADRYQSAPTRPAMAETRGSPSGQRNGAAKTWNDLTQEARVSLDGFIKSSPTFSSMKLDQARAEILKQADETHFRTR